MKISRGKLKKIIKEEFDNAMARPQQDYAKMANDLLTTAQSLQGVNVDQVTNFILDLPPEKRREVHRTLSTLKVIRAAIAEE